MSKSHFKKACIRGIVTTVPSITKSLDEEVDQYGGDAAQIERIKKVIGLNQRRVVDDKTTTADLCEHATEELIKSLDLDLNSIDGLICVTQTPDYLQPCNAAVLHGRLKLTEDCACFDVNLGCSGYVYALWLAFMMVETDSCSRVLLLAGDTISRCVNPRDRSVAPLFGDAGSATLVEKSSEEQSSWFSLNTDGSGFESLIIPAGGFRTPSSCDTQKEHTDNDGNVRSAENLFMSGPDVFNFSIKQEPKAVQAILDYSGFSIEEIDYFFFHQANQYIISNIARRLKIPLEKAPSSVVGKYGNLSTASIPSIICDHFGGEGSPSGYSTLSGFGVGLSWASSILSLSNLCYCKVATYKI